MIDVERLVVQLKKFDALRDDDAIKIGTIGRIQPRYAKDWLIHLEPSIRGTLNNIGITKPYQRQAEAINKSSNGADVVLESLPLVVKRWLALFQCSIY